MKTTLSRRAMLQVVGAARAVGTAGPVGRAIAQPARRIERLDPQEVAFK